MNDAGEYGRLAGRSLQDVADYWLGKLYLVLYLSKHYEELYLNCTLENMLHCFVLLWDFSFKI